MECEDPSRRSRELLEQGRAGEALATLEAAADDIALAEPDAAARLLVDAVEVGLLVGGPSRAVAIAERGVDLARRTGGVGWQRALVRLGDALSWEGRYLEARDAWTGASIDPGSDDAAMLAERANALLRLGHPVAHDATLRALVAARRSPDPIRVLDALDLVTVAEVRAGRLREALAAAEESVAKTVSDGTLDEVDALGLLAWVLAQLGDEAACRAAIAEAERGLAALRVTQSGGLARGLLALSLGAWSEAAAALEWKRASFDIGSVAAMTMLRPFAAEMIEACARSGRFDRARQVLAACLPIALGSGQPRLVGPIRRAQAILEDNEEAFRAALEAHGGWENRFEAGRTRLAYGEHLRRRRRRAEARAQLEAAVAEFEHVGAAVWRDRALSELRLAGARLPARQPLPATAPERLTRQEGEVVQLLRAGFSNREIAERLVLSVKTVEGHVTAVYGKLGVASRGQALAMLADSGTKALSPDKRTKVQ